MFKVNNKNVIDVVLVFLLLTLNCFTPFSVVSIVDFGQVILAGIGLRSSVPCEPEQVFKATECHSSSPLFHIYYISMA